MNSPSVDQTPEQPPMRGVGSSDSSAWLRYVNRSAIVFFLVMFRIACRENDTLMQFALGALVVANAYYHWGKS